jgi:hypothetical protein
MTMSREGFLRIKNDIRHERGLKAYGGILQMKVPVDDKGPSRGINIEQSHSEADLHGHHGY